MDQQLGSIETDERYWSARKSLRLWPVEGQDLKAAVIKFIEEKLKAPPGRVGRDDFEAREIYSPPETLAQHQVVVAFSTVALRDEVKSMSRNLSGKRPQSWSAD